MLERLFPFLAAPRPQLNPAAEDKQPNLSKKFKVRTLGLGFYPGYLNVAGYNMRKSHFEEAPYDFKTIIEAIHTDSYVRQALLKYKDLFWKEGWDIVGENDEAVDYLAQRLDLMELAMDRSFNNFLVEVVDQLVKFSNCFIVKARGTLDPFYRVGMPDDKKNIIGYYVIPVETVRIRRDKHNKPLAYRQVVSGENMAANTDDEPVWPADEVIHLHLDKQPGYAFGMPWIGPALDDVKSLRQVEQDGLNLIHNQLFPIYKYIVGTPEAPATDEELANAAAELENMRVEGGLVLPERHDVDVIGSEGKALDITEMFNHFKERVAIGLGVYPHHLGMGGQMTNRSTTDRTDVALYDRIKQIQSYFEDEVRLKIFNEILREGGFRPIVTPLQEGQSDRCVMRFREIDIDTQIKRENHILNKFNSNAIDWTEMRSELSLPETANPNLLFISMQAEIQTATQIEVQKVQAQLQPKAAPAAGSGAGSVPAPKKPDAIPSSTGVTPNMPNTKKGTANISQPSNQHGRRLSPDVRRSDNDVKFGLSESLLEDLVELIDGPEENEIGEIDE